MREKMHKTRWPLVFAALLGALLLSDCGFRPEGVEPERPASDASVAAALPEETTAPQGKAFTVTYRVNGTETTETVSEGGSVQAAPEFLTEESRGIVAWKNANGTEVDIRAAAIYADTVYEAVLGPEVRRDGAYFAPGSDGLFHPLDKFTRSDAARAVYALLEVKPTGETFLKDVTTNAKCYSAATALVTAGYMKLDEMGRFYPDVAVTRADLTALLENVFSSTAVERALAAMTDEAPLTRAEAAAAINALLCLDETAAERAPYYPDMSPDMEHYAAVELAGQSASISWLTGDTAEPGFVNLDGYLYCVGDNGYFLRDTMVGTLYFDRSGRYTSGDEAVDKFVADLIDAHTTSAMTREEMLRAVYEYVRDHYLYLKRNLYEVGETGWELPEALLMFQSGKGNCYNFTAAFWALARGIGYDAVCYSGLVGVGRDPHSWVEITFDGVPYVFDVETEMSYRLVNDYITSMYWKTYEEVAAWSYVRTPEEAAAVAAE